MYRKPETEDASVLCWMGLMGHQFAVTCKGEQGRRTSRGECNDAKTAQTWAAEVPDGRAFKRLKSGEYRQIA